MCHSQPVSRPMQYTRHTQTAHRMVITSQDTPPTHQHTTHMLQHICEEAVDTRQGSSPPRRVLCVSCCGNKGYGPGPGGDYVPFPGYVCVSGGRPMHHHQEAQGQGSACLQHPRPNTPPWHSPVAKTTKAQGALERIQTTENILLATSQSALSTVFDAHCWHTQLAVAPTVWGLPLQLQNNNIPVPKYTPSCVIESANPLCPQTHLWPAIGLTMADAQLICQPPHTLPLLPWLPAF